MRKQDSLMIFFCKKFEFLHMLFLAFLSYRNGVVSVIS